MATLAQALRRLQQASAPALAQAQPDRPAVAAEPLTPQSRQDLIQLLRAQDLSAQDRFEALAAGLRAMLGEPRFETLHEHIEQLRFAQALALLEETAA